MDGGLDDVVFALDHADGISRLENGSIVKSGPTQAVHGDEYIRETYPGE